MQVTDHNLDQVIMSLTSAKWQKVAMVLARSLTQLEDEGVHILAGRIAARIEFLVLAGHLEAQGDLSSSRHSEIRLPERAR
jgi:hypothetical protein